MTVADIQEYIDKSIQESEQVGMSGYDSALYLKNSMRIVRSMLDELEQPIEIDTDKYFEKIDKLIDKEMAQYLKDQMKQALKKEIEKGVNNDTTPTNV